MLQTSTAPWARTSAKLTQRPTSRNPEPIVVAPTEPHPVFGRPVEGIDLKTQMPERLASWLQLATTEFVRLRDDPESDDAEFDAASKTMDEIYYALILQKTKLPRVVVLQLEAMAARASLHTPKGEEPELDETISFAEFKHLLDNLKAATATLVPTKQAGALNRGRKLTRAGLLTRYQSFLVQELETVSWELYGQRDLAKHYVLFDAAVRDRCGSIRGPFLDASKLIGRAGKVLQSLKIDTELSHDTICQSR